jgi:hypothetical protein
MVVTLPEALYPDTLRAISIAGPFAYLITIGEKAAEYRSWKTSFRGPVLLHVSLGREWENSWDEVPEISLEEKAKMKSSIIGIAEVYDCTFDAMHGCYAHWMRNPILFKEYIPNVKGNRNYWSAKTPEHIEAFNQAWQRVQDLADMEPAALFNIALENGLVRISSQKTKTSFLVKDEGLWDSLLPDIEDGTIELGKSEFAALYKERIEL